MILVPRRQERSNMSYFWEIAIRCCARACVARVRRGENFEDVLASYVKLTSEQREAVTKLFKELIQESD